MLNVTVITRTWTYDDDDEPVTVSITSEDITLRFDDLVDLMEEYSDGSSYPMSGSLYEWLIKYDTNSYTGIHYEYSLHYSDTASKEKYWKKALTVVGFM